MSSSNYIAHVSKDGQRKQSVFEHLTGVGKLAYDFGVALNVPNLCRLVGLLHDFGKYSNEFQTYIQSATGLIDYDEDQWVDAGALKGKIDHSTAGAQYIYSKLEIPSTGKAFITRDIIGIAIASHHSGLLNICDGKGNYLPRLTKSIPKYIKKIPEPLKVEIDNLIPKTVAEINAIFDKKLRTDNRFDPFKAQMLVRMIYSTLIDADRTNTADFEYPIRRPIRSSSSCFSMKKLSERLETHIGKFGEPNTPINRIRNKISLECLNAAKYAPGFFTLTVPTGGGKTLSSLRFALHHARINELKRVFYIIPFTSIIEQNAEVAREALEEKNEKGKYKFKNVLEQHSNIGEGKENSWRKLLAENWDAPVVFTTTVSFLESLFSAGTRNYRRTRNLSRSVIILDEVQALPPHTLTLACQAMNYLVESEGCSVVLCSATQPLLYIDPKNNRGLRRGLRMPTNSEICTVPGELFQNLKRVEIIDRCKDNGTWSSEELGEAVANSAKRFGNALCIVNTKPAAAAVFAKAKEFKELFDGDVFHLSTNMCPAHRLEKLNYIKERLKTHPMVVISTQLIEAGVDIDFCCVWRTIAGLDSIAQAAGRCNRNGLMKTLGQVNVVNLDPSEENTASLTSLELGKNLGKDALTTSMAMDWEPIGLDTIRYYFGRYYKELQERKMTDIPIDPVEAGLPRHYQANTACGLLYTNPSGDSAFSTPFKAVGEKFYVIHNPTYTVIVPWKKEGQEIVADLCSNKIDSAISDLLRRAQRYAVQIYSNSALDRALKEKDAIFEAQPESGILCLKKQFYDNDMGISKNPGIIEPDIV